MRTPFSTNEFNGFMKFIDVHLRPMIGAKSEKF